MDLLISKLKKIEKQNYRAYQQIKGQYDFKDFTLHIDQVQGDPYASPSRLRVVRPWSVTGLDFLKEKSAPYQIAARDFIARSLAQFTKQDNDVLSPQRVRSCWTTPQCYLLKKASSLDFV